ncbi:MAG: hypothetical protein JSV34_02945 [Candidatus Omnitrophota bacterium]|nr:MAG: hypothetical protein JSV34_02945 [Candidatus Omnitrophota bacterium]
MGNAGLRNNYLVTLVKFILFLVIFCFLIKLGKEFWKEIRGEEGFKMSVLYMSVLFSFMFYTFIADLNDFYKKVQRFFFRSSFVSFLVPSVLVLLGIGYFLMPKIFGFSFNKDTFVFLGGFVLTAHLNFVARETKGHTFNTFINYLFVFSILCIINLLLFVVYLKVAFNVHIGEIFVGGLKQSVVLINSLFSRMFY